MEESFPSTIQSDNSPLITTIGNNNNNYILLPPNGKAVTLPSIRISSTAFETGTQYGGKGDKAHLGGFTDMDIHGISPASWKWMVSSIGVHSLIDVGCGRGISTSWFLYHGVDILCVEGSHDAVEKSVLPHPNNKHIVEHDFSRGPWWPEKTYDAIWCVEFLEHVGRNLQKNYLPTFRKAAMIFVSHSNWGGHHHVEVHDSTYWIQKMTMFGFIYSEDLTEKIHDVATEEMYSDIAPNGRLLNAQHVWLTLKVFINPAVAALPQHAHLLAEPGCFFKRIKDKRLNRECGTGIDPQAKIETKLPESFKALNLTYEQDTTWFNYIAARVENRTKDGLAEQAKLGINFTHSKIHNNRQPEYYEI